MSSRRLCRLRPLALVSGMTLLAALGARAELLSYDLVFRSGSSIPPDGSPMPDGGSFTWDTEARRFTAFSVDWDGVTIDIRPSANAPVTQASDRTGHVFHASDVYQALTRGWTLPNGRYLKKRWQLWGPNPQGKKLHSSLNLNLFYDNAGIVIGGQHPDPSYVATHATGAYEVHATGGGGALGPTGAGPMVDSRNPRGWIKYRIDFDGKPQSPSVGFFAWDPERTRFTEFRARWRNEWVDLLESSNGPVTQGGGEDLPTFGTVMFYQALSEGHTLPGGERLEKVWSTTPPNPGSPAPQTSLSLKLFTGNRGVLIGGKIHESDADFFKGSFSVQRLGPDDHEGPWRRDAPEGDTPPQKPEEPQEPQEPRSPPRFQVD